MTFLFSDIEGSVRLWRDNPQAMSEALARHDGLLRNVTAEAGGHFVKSTGDGAIAVFQRARDALAAAVAAQRLLVAEEFPEIGQLRVRMALHTGEAEERQGDYFGHAVNRAARLMAAANGGQILVSAATREILDDPEVELIDLGDHRLRDLTRPERVHQVLHPDLPDVFPPLATLDTVPNNLPTQLTSFIGREEEVRRVSKLIDEARLVSLTGTGGAGKTRLAIQVAAELVDSFSHGAWLVELAPLSDPALVIEQTAEPFGVRDMKTESGRRLIDVLGDFLSDRELLLVLDNCEHVIEASAELAERLLTRCPQLKILATSRELLGIPGEAVYPIPPLGLPTDSWDLADGDAVRLFVERASRVHPEFRLDEGGAAAVREIARRLDGLPLAIELAASRANLMTPQEILERLDEQFRLITSRRRGQGRHATLDAAMDWSYDLLAEEEGALFRQLAVFAGGWTLDAAEAVYGQADVLGLLGRLIDQSLVEVSSMDTYSRYRLLEPVRQYALTKLSEAGEEQEARRRHAEHFVALAEESESGLRGADQGRWARRIEMEHDNIRSALDWSLRAENDETALRLLAAMGWFWWLRGYWKDAQRWFRRVYDTTPHADPVLRARAVYKVAGIEVQRMRPAEVLPLFEEVLDVLRAHGTERDLAWVKFYLADSAQDNVTLAEEAVGHFRAVADPWGEAFALFTLGQTRQASQDEMGAELELMREAVDRMTALGDRWTAGWLAFVLGQTLAYAGRYQEAQDVIDKTLELIEGTDDRWVSLHCKSRLAMVAAMTDRAEEAERLFEESLPLHQQIGDENCMAFGHTYLGQVLMDQGDLDGALHHLGLGLEGYQELRNAFGVESALRRLGWLASARGDTRRAAQLLAVAEELRSGRRGFMTVYDRGRTAEMTESLHTQVAADQLAEWEAEGRRMTEAEAIRYALN